ncbi:hypothetical protein CFBP1159_03170 [Xanthomonas arboricola pv. corylina]|uniref:Cellulase n=1 Tax=Xanthomonas arboricola pv. corylina TaxID=487821 RepID=A0A8D6XX24_9XANT|nr:hypothetical protein CFBP1159_03170 [Xanthomonas arboricola pv. corylina]CAE6696861.1 hypothetical protein CFBP1159_03170 [Xanthomonas arboricola pv. corylina]
MLRCAQCGLRAPCCTMQLRLRPGSGMQALLAFADGGCDNFSPQLGTQQQAWTAGLSTFATRYAKNAGVIGIDLGSSGYRNATWAGNSADADWNRIASRAAAWAMAIHATGHGNTH